MLPRSRESSSLSAEKHSFLELRDVNALGVFLPLINLNIHLTLGYKHFPSSHSLLIFLRTRSYKTGLIFALQILQYYIYFVILRICLYIQSY